MRRRFLIGMSATLAAACAPAPPQAAAQAKPGRSDSRYRWEELTSRAAFPVGYNYPVHVAPDGRFVALHPEGTFESRDGRAWTSSPLPVNGINSAYLDYVLREGAVHALGRHTGNYQGFGIDPVITRTVDFRSWEQVGHSDTLPKLIFYSTASFGGFIWLVGGYDGRRESAAIWRSRDALKWEKVADETAFGARSGTHLIVFGDRLWMLGGGLLDGEIKGDAWSSANGIDWRKETDAVSDPLPTGFTAHVHEGEIWLLGANRSGGFSSSSLVSSDGRTWERSEAPWSPRGGISAWSQEGALYITGGKFSRPKPDGEIEFIYSNDVWRMTRA